MLLCNRSLKLIFGYYYLIDRIFHQHLLNMIRTRLKEISLGMLLPYTFCKYSINPRSEEIVGTSSTENTLSCEFFDASSIMNP